MTAYPAPPAAGHRIINHLVDVYPRVVGCGVDIFPTLVNDTGCSPAVHLTLAELWFAPTVRPQARSARLLRWNGLSPESTDAMTTDELRYSLWVTAQASLAANLWTDARPTPTNTIGEIR
jgi:hypothetical protein